MRLILCWLCFSSAVSFAAIDDEFVRRLARARTPHEAADLAAGYEQLKIARSACRLQLRARNTPYACYESLALEIRWGMHPSHSSRTALTRRLDGLCGESAEALRIPRGDSVPPFVSRECRKSVAAAAEIRKYRERRTTGPEFEQ